VAYLATPERCRSLDGLLQVDPELGAARATWLRRLAVQASPPAMHDEMDKVVFLRGLGAGECGVRPSKPGRGNALVSGRVSDRRFAR
jgi:hypothetical protein